MGVMFTPTLSLKMVGCDLDSQAFEVVRDYTRVIGVDDHNPFEQSIGSTMFTPVPVQWTSLTLPRGDIFDHPAAFHSWVGGHGWSEIKALARVPLVLWNYPEGEAAGPGWFSSRLVSDPIDCGAHLLANADGSLVWSWTVWPLETAEYDALAQATDGVQWESCWGECGCAHDMDAGEIIESYLDAHPDVYAEAKEHATTEAEIYDWVFENKDPEMVDWWLESAHTDPWDITDQMMRSPAGREVRTVLGELLASTEVIDQRVRSLLAEGDQSWSYSWEERYLWPAR